MELVSYAGALRTGLTCCAAGRDGAKAFDFLSQALDAADASLSSSDGSSQQLPELAAPPPDTAVEGDVPPLLSAAEVRYSALTWIGRWVVPALVGLQYCPSGCLAAAAAGALLQVCFCAEQLLCMPPLGPLPPSRCYMEGAGEERSIVKAADCFRQAGNAAELGQLAALKSMYAAVADADLAVDAELAG